jgi:hypothetical protein
MSRRMTRTTLASGKVTLSVAPKRTQNPGPGGKEKKEHFGTTLGPL